MSGTPSPSAVAKFAKQSAKGTPATTGFVTALATRSSLNAAFDNPQRTTEHGAGAADRATAHKSATRRGSYLARAQYGGYLYPNLFGIMLLGAGFKVTTTGAGADKTHVFKLGLRSEQLYLTMLETIGSKTRRGSDMRVSALNLIGTQENVTFDATLAGLAMADAAGSETTTAEDTNQLLGSEGTLSLHYDPAGANTEILNTTTDTVQEVRLAISNPADEADRSIHTFGRADLPQTGVDITTNINGIEIDYSIYEDIIEGGASGNAPSPNTAICSLSYSFATAIDIATASVPYSCTILIPHLEVNLDDFTAEGDNLIRWNLTGRMIDDVTDPITITLVNAKTSY